MSESVEHWHFQVTSGVLQPMPFKFDASGFLFLSRVTVANLNLKEAHTTGSSSIKDLIVAVPAAGVVDSEDGHGAWGLEGTYLK